MFYIRLRSSSPDPDQIEEPGSQRNDLNLDTSLTTPHCDVPPPADPDDPPHDVLRP